MPGHFYKGLIRCGRATEGRQQHQHNISECCEMRVGWRSAAYTSEVDGVVVGIWRLNHIETS
eukprot:12929128-Prorocentrum_lima.AAC.1